MHLHKHYNPPTHHANVRACLMTMQVLHAYTSALACLPMKAIWQHPRSTQQHAEHRTETTTYNSTTSQNRKGRHTNPTAAHGTIAYITTGAHGTIADIKL